MNDLLVNEIAEFINASNIRLSIPEIRKSEVLLDGTQKVSITAHFRMRENELKDRGILLPLIVHTAFDVLVDCLHPELEGETFRQRTVKLPNHTSLQKIFKGAYRLMRVIRNGIVHSRNASDHTGTGYSLSYEVINNKNQQKTRYAVSCNDRALVNLRTIVVLFLKSPDITDKYFESALVALYLEMLDGVEDFADDISGELEIIDSGINFRTSVRYRVAVDIGESDRESGVVSVSRVTLGEMESQWANDEFYCRDGDNVYLIPGEVLGSGLSFSISTMEDWIIQKGNSLARF